MGRGGERKVGLVFFLPGCLCQSLGHELIISAARARLSYGKERVWSNFVLCFVLSIWNGICFKSGLKIGPQTGHARQKASF